MERLLAGPLLDLIDAVDTAAISRDASQLGATISHDAAQLASKLAAPFAEQFASPFAERFAAPFAELLASPSYVWAALAAAVLALVACMAGACGSMRARLAYGQPPTAEFVELQRTRSFCRRSQACAPTRVDAEARPSVKLPSARHVALERVKSFSRGAAHSDVPRPWAPRGASVKASGPSGPRELV